MPVLRTSIDEPTEHISIETELAAEWKFQTGPLAPTELLHANLSQTLGVLTLSATGGQAARIANFSKTLGSLTISATGTVPSAITASLTKTFGALTVSAAGTVTPTIIADLGKTFGSITISAVGKGAVVASLSKTLGTLALSSTGTTVTAGALLLEDGSSFLLTEASDHILME